MDPQVHVWNGQEHAKAESHEQVQRQILRKESFYPQRPGLSKSDHHQDDDDDHERSDSSGLLLKIMTCKTLDRYLVKSIFAPRARILEKSERQRKVGVKAKAVDSVLGNTRKVRLIPNQRDGSTTTILIGDKASVNRRRAYKRITTVHTAFDAGGRITRAADDQWFVCNNLVSNGVRIENLSMQAVCLTTESKSRIFEWSTIISIKTATVVFVPE
ncbi:MAG: hypothetical protein Q9162_000367 [Coniocarpon cinnabarinum]